MTQEDRQITASRELSAQLPLNDLGLPLGVYRTDLLPWHNYKPDVNAITSALPFIGDGIKIVTGADVYDPSSAPTRGHTAVMEAMSELGIETEDDDSDESDESDGDGDGGVEEESIESEESIELAEVYQTPVITEHRIAGFRASDLETAFIWLHYDEGFPAFDDGQPFWHCLPFEPPAAYEIFQRYLQMHQGKPPTDIEDPDDYGEVATGIRSISVLTEILNVSGKDSEVLPAQDTYKMYYHLYYWSYRAKAYDLFRITQHRKQMEIRAIETQDSHYVQSAKLMNKLMVYMDQDEDFMDMMTPAVAVKFYQMLTQLQRVSVGLPAGGPSREPDSMAGQSFEHTMQQLAHNAHSDVKDKSSTNMKLLDNALKDTDAVEVLQKLIISVSGAQQNG